MRERVAEEMNDWFLTREVCVREKEKGEGERGVCVCVCVYGLRKWVIGFSTVRRGVCVRESV